MNRMTRIIVNDRLDQFRFEIDPTQVIDATSIEEVNGEHSVTITTLQELEKTDRLLIKDGMGRWHEYVVLGIEERHTAGGAIQHEYYCVWSLQYDLSATFINDQFGCGVVPGHASIPQTPRRALECALEGTSRWAIGTITVTTQSSASFYRRSGWEGLQTVIERWGGSLRATITVGLSGAVTRAVDLLEHEGDATATRRFDYGFDVTSIKRVVSDEIWPCRIVPLGKSQETEAGGYTRRPSIESVNQGIIWLQDDAAVPLVRIPDGSGGWEYPTAIIKNDTYEEPADLLAWAQAHISDYTRPIVSYEAEVAQFAQAGLDPHGVALGDEVIVVDRTFGEGGLRITARVARIESSLLDPADVKLTIGNAQPTLASQLSDLAVSVAAVSEQTASSWQWQSSSDYMSALLGRINDEANATGGYTYITEGQGIRTYDVPVSDPLVGAEASAVVEVKGGTIRIANSRDAQGNWEWKTVFTSGHIAADLVTALAVNAGYIGNPTNGAYWDLDQGILQVKDSQGNTIISFESSGAFIKGNLLLVDAADFYEGARTYQSETQAGMLATADMDLVESIHGRLSQAAQGKTIYIPVLRMQTRDIENSPDGPVGDIVYIHANSSDTTGDQTMGDHSSLACTGQLDIIADLDQTHKETIRMRTNRLEIDYQRDTSVYPVTGSSITLYDTSIYSSRTITTSSDRRLKQHVGYLDGDEAAGFVRALRPAEFRQGGGRYLGFYAQDVEEADPWRVLVGKTHEDYKTLDYQGIIAPLVAYCQQLEKRIEQLEGGAQ